ncbi:hypothetical protein dsat_1805 [Alkalidesulfovibrio alkalitolerans DSM 16529]|uniref:Uncharacterized protein n=1 Tax=Alkalidesulfovibrio alkalitolerans DSM 16529 TaxID=1121439 RepID=S7TGE9_9BACT|nr:hypothetical protein dsat_1805 [Alkalidesulfovibrio alkalitolerans DSM 16529]
MVEKALLKLAKQLGAYDEASLMELWDKYAEQVASFEPSKRWEEAVLALSMIQGVRFKNQLFNYHWSKSRESAGDHPAPAGDSPTPERPSGPRPAGGQGRGKGGKVLRFVPRED